MAIPKNKLKDIAERLKDIADFNILGWGLNKLVC